MKWGANQGEDRKIPSVESQTVDFFLYNPGFGHGWRPQLFYANGKLSVNTELFSVSYLNNSGTEITTVLQFSLCD